MNESFVTVVGNLTGDPVLRHTRSGKPFVTFRVASTARRRDPSSGEYVDGGTNYVNVVAFNGLAANLEASFSRGQRVLIYGRLRVNQYLTKDNVASTSVDVEAYNAGHDLTWGHTTFARSVRPPGGLGVTDPLRDAEVQEAIHAAVGPGGDTPGAPAPFDAADCSDPHAAEPPGDPLTDPYVIARAG